LILGIFKRFINKLTHNFYRRKDTCNETLSVNGKRLKDYVSKMILAPRRGKYAKRAPVAEATKEVLSGPGASFQNCTREIVRKA
jgi:ribosomal protein S17E